MRIDRDEFKKRIQQFKSTIFIAIVFLFLLIITSMIKGVYTGNINNMSEQVAILDNEIVAANKIVITDTVLTNIGNVKYDVTRCENDDKEVFKLFKPILSYKNADVYNASLVKFNETVSSSGINRVFKKIDYKDLEYQTEEEYGGQSCDRYSSLPSSFQSTVVCIDGDRYDYVAVVKIDGAEPGRGKHNVEFSKIIVLTYSTDSNGIIYDSFDAMVCK